MLARPGFALTSSFALIALSCARPEPQPPFEPPADIPPWTEPALTRPPPRTFDTGPQASPIAQYETIRIQPPVERDPVDELLRRRGRNRIRTLSLHQAPVDDTLRMFAGMGRFNVVIPGELGSRKVSLELRNVTLASAFRAVLVSAKLDARVVTDDIIEIRTASAP